MRCLLDKVTARHIVQGLLKLTEGRDPIDAELFALDLYSAGVAVSNFPSRASAQDIALFILPQTEKVLQRLTQLPHFAALIRSFLGDENDSCKISDRVLKPPYSGLFVL